jgi:hypothetical protein
VQTTLFLVWDGPGAFPTSLFMCIVRTYRIISTRDNAPEYVITSSLKSFNLFSAASRLLDEGIQLLYKIGDWYIEKELTYLRIYGATAAPNLLPKFVPDRLVLREIAYETLLFGFNASLVKEKLRLFITYPMHISPYGLNNSVFARIERLLMNTGS